MRNITKALGIFGLLAVVSTTSYFIVLYEHLTKLILAYGIAGIIIFCGFLYVYEWMKNKDEDLSELGKSIDMTRDYMRDLEGKIGNIK